MYTIATKIICPYCSHARFWRLRRNKFKCKKCRREWSQSRQSHGVRASAHEWRECIQVFLKQRAIMAVVTETGASYVRTQRMLTAVRTIMTTDIPEPFSGICEADETFIGGQWKNKRRSIRRAGTKTGHGTTKLPVTGVLSRTNGQVRVQILTVRTGQTYWDFIRSCLAEDCILYTDGYKMNRGVSRYGIKHDWVNHHLGEYVRGDIHTNGIEGFWGYLKRNLAAVGGIRPKHIHLFVGEFTWRYNNRKLSHEEQVEKLMQLLKIT